MVKVKNRKRISVDQIQRKRQLQTTKKPLNPFEVHINKEKMKVIGKKLKNEKGLPGVSRGKAIQKRKRTLLNEYKLQHKSNRFMDKRIGEKTGLSQEDKITARFTAVRAKAHSKKNIFNLADDEILTHKGQILSEIEKFDDPRSDDEESVDQNETGKLDASFVKDAHFGGGIIKNKTSSKQLIEQLIEESKKRKAEKQKVKEATLELTEKLDSEWKDLVQLVNKNNKNEALNDTQKPKLDEYDKVMRELKFEARGTVSDRLKSEEEIAKQEKEKLEKLEQERLERMEGFVESSTSKAKHRSADDLDDDFVYESDVEYMLSYDQDGQSNVHVEAVHNGKIVGDTDQQQKKSDSESEEEEVSDSEDSLADLKEDEVSSAESDNESSKIEPPTLQSPKSNTEKCGNKRKSEEFPCGKEAKKLKTDCTTNGANIRVSEAAKAEKEELEKAGNELPFTFSIPESYENLKKTLQGRPITHQKIILERMIKCNHPSLSQGNKQGLGFLFDYLLRYLKDLFSNAEDIKTLKESLYIFKAFMLHIYDLAQLNPENTHNCVVNHLKEEYATYKNNKTKYPGLEVLVLLKLISLLFSTSDFRHQVVTPSFIFMEQMLKNCRVRSVGDVAYGLYLCTLVLEYTSLSKRYLPSAINFLSGLLHMAIPKNSVKIIKVRPPFKPLSSYLFLTKNCSKLTALPKLNVSSLVEKKFTDEFRVTVLYVILKLLKEFKENFKLLSSNVEIFDDALKYVLQIPMDFYPEDVQKYHKDFCDSLAKLKSDRKLQYLVMEQKKPKVLRLYEPKIVEIYDGRRHKVQSREKAEKEKLIHKLKKETKGALREIRRDKAFLGRVKINQRIQGDKERREKVNKIFAEASLQQSELNALDRQKKKKK